MGKVLHIWNHARIAQLCWPLGIVPYVVSICWLYLLWLASIGSFYMPMCESCWVCVFVACINLILPYQRVNLVWILSGVYLVACINWMLLYTYIWILFESCWVCILCVASIGCFYAPMCQSCWVCILWLASIGCFYTPMCEPSGFVEEKWDRSLCINLLVKTY